MFYDQYDADMMEYDRLPEVLRLYLQQTAVAFAASYVSIYRRFPLDDQMRILERHIADELHHTASIYKRKTGYDYPHVAANATVQPYGPTIPHPRNRPKEYKNVKFRHR